MKKHSIPAFEEILARAFLSADDRLVRTLLLQLYGNRSLWCDTNKASRRID